MLTYNTDNMVHQRFDAFPAPIMDYILTDLKPEHLLKLYQCCKFFYDKYRLNIIRHLEIVNDGRPEVFDPFKSVICISNPLLFKIKDFWITDSIIRKGTTYFQALPEFTNCTVKKLVCRFLKLKAYEALAKAGTIEELKIGYVTDDTYEFVSFDEIIGKVPNATSIELSETILSPSTFDTLLTLDHKVKISTFILHNINSIKPMFDNRDIITEFLFKFAADDCKIRVDFGLCLEESNVHRELDELLKEFEDRLNRIITQEFEMKKLKHELSAREV